MYAKPQDALAGRGAVREAAGTQSGQRAHGRRVFRRMLASVEDFPATAAIVHMGKLGPDEIVEQLLAHLSREDPTGIVFLQQARGPVCYDLAAGDVMTEPLPAGPMLAGHALSPSDLSRAYGIAKFLACLARLVRHVHPLADEFDLDKYLGGGLGTGTAEPVEL
jgi:hypothetical protein